MNPIVSGTIFATALAAGIVVLLETGLRIGARRLAEEGEVATKGFGAIEGALFALNAMPPCTFHIPNKSITP